MHEALCHGAVLPQRKHERKLANYRARRIRDKHIRGVNMRGGAAPPSEVLAEAAHALAAPRTIGMVCFGDPLAGRSALDRMMGER